MKINNEEIVEKKIHRTNLQRIAHTFCLLLPIFSAFLGYYIAPHVYKLFSTEKSIDFFSFIVSLFLFIFSSAIVFIFTRSTNPIINIKIKKNESES